MKLKAVLDQAVARARGVIKPSISSNDIDDRSLDAAQRDQVAERVGLAAIKYFDLSHALNSDYRFNLDQMVAMEGNTAPYMMYAYARVRSIGRKAGVDFAQLPPSDFLALSHPMEIALAKKVLQFADVLEVLNRDLRPNVLTDYLFELAKSFSRFYDKKLGVRVIDASPEEVRNARLALCDISARVLRLGLRLLGIETVEQM